MQCAGTPAFLSTLSLRRATLRVLDGSKSSIISIHALLAESDHSLNLPSKPIERFLSTLSLRRATQRHSPDKKHQRISIHALLAESDIGQMAIQAIHNYFYPRSPCGERRKLCNLLLTNIGHFYPRSPCGERRQRHSPDKKHQRISIHALLAESDRRMPLTRFCPGIFLSTLSLRRATTNRRLIFF